MKKKLLFAFVAMFSFIAVNAQTTIFEDNLDSYTAGEFLVEQSTFDFWDTWTSNPGSSEDALVSDDQQNTPMNSFVVEGTSTDLILKFGNRTSGEYEVNWNMFIAEDFGGYYNFQKFEAPGNEWAFDVFFGNDGNGYLKVGDVDYDFTHPNDAWFAISHNINITDDEATLTIDGTVVHTWQYSMQTVETSGINQLGGVDFYASAPEGQDAKYYIDDVIFIELAAGSTNAIVNVSETSITAVVPQFGSSTEGFDVTNDGQQDLTYNLYGTYPAADATPLATIPSTTGIQENQGQLVSNPNYVAGGGTNAKDGVMNYDGDNESAIGYTNGGEMRVAAVFPPSKVEDFIGTTLTAVDVYIATGASNFKVQIYSKGSPNLPGPGELVYEQDASITLDAWSHIVLDTPIYLDGNEISIGYFIDHGEGTFPAGLDAGPVDINGDWIASGPGWGRLSNDPQFDGNWNVRGVVEGNALSPWLSFLPWEGTLSFEETDAISMTIDASELEVGPHIAIANVRNNDPENEYVEVVVTIDVFNGIDGIKQVVAMYPNPASESVNISANGNTIEMIKIYSQTGQLVKVINVNAKESMIIISELTQGLYIVDVQTEKGNSRQKLFVK